MKKLCAAIVILAASVVLAQSPDTMNIRGKVSKVHGTGFTLTTDSGDSVEVKEKQGFKVYDSIATDLSHVKDTAFIGVTTKKKADGKDYAVEIHIFPEELRGTGEGSHMIGAPMGAAPRGLMTNGTVSKDLMTNGTVSKTLMTNGAVAKTGGGTLQVKYAGGVTEVVVPADVTVTEIKVVSHPIAVGDALTVTGMKAGASSSKVLLQADRAALIHP